jgi:hypothetical protein
MAGDVVSEVAIGEQAEIVLSFHNSIPMTDDLRFGAIIEVRDSQNEMIYLAWQSGTVAPEKAYQFATSWVPEKQGVYYLKTRVITALPPAEIIGVLSPVLESKFTVV